MSARVKLQCMVTAVAWVSLGAAFGATAADGPIPGIGPVGEVKEAFGGFTFAEGPAPDAEGNLYFTDVPNQRIHKIDTAGKLSTFLENTEGTNGLMFDNRGRLLGCNAKRRALVATDIDSKETTVVADKCDGEPLVGLNDLVVDSHGGVYVTGPVLGQPKRPELGHSVYYVAPSGEVTRLPIRLTYPNGILLSRDEQTLFVLPTIASALYAYPVQSPGVVGEGREFCPLVQPEGKKNVGGDGMTMDTKGNLYLTNPGMKAIQVVSPEGKLLGMIPVPNPPTNCAFGGADSKTLFITTRPAVYTAQMEVAGHYRPKRGE